MSFPCVHTANLKFSPAKNCDGAFIIVATLLLVVRWYQAKPHGPSWRPLALLEKRLLVDGRRDLLTRLKKKWKRP